MPFTFSGLTSGILDLCKSAEREVDRRKVSSNVIGLAGERAIEEPANDLCPRHTLVSSEAVELGSLPRLEVDVRAAHTPHHTP